MLAIRQALISRGELEEADTNHAKMEPLWARLRTEMEEDIKAKQDKLDTDRAKAKMKAINELMERREAERNADHKKMMAKMKADQEERKAGMIACLRKTEVRIETGQEQSNTGIQTDLEEVEATDLEANPEETEAIVERREIPNEEATVDY
jgi:hypothetical protein